MLQNAAAEGLLRFDGFKLLDFEKLSGALPVTIAKRSLGSKGRNWGAIKRNGPWLPGFTLRRLCFVYTSAAFVRGLAIRSNPGHLNHLSVVSEL
jgi:hypothetical protein